MTTAHALMSLKESNSFPNELWMQIFHASVHSYDDHGDRQITTLAEVCRNWREILQSPEFWEDITLYKKDFDNDKKAETFLTRSGKRSLKIRLLASEIDTTKVTAITSLVGKEASRTRILEVEHDDIATLSKMVDLLGWDGDNAAPRDTQELRILRIIWKKKKTVPFSYRQEFGHNPLVFSGSRNLRSLSLPLGFHLSKDATFWSFLTSIEIAEPRKQEWGRDDQCLATVLGVLGLCTSLHNFRFNCYRRRSIRPSRGVRVIELAQLHRIEVLAPCLGLEVLKSIQAPRLSSLHLWTPTESSWLEDEIRSLTKWMQGCRLSRSPLSDEARFDHIQDPRLVAELLLFTKCRRIIFKNCCFPKSGDLTSVIIAGTSSITNETTWEFYDCKDVEMILRATLNHIKEHELTFPTVIIDKKRYVEQAQIEAMLGTDSNNAADDTVVTTGLLPAFELDSSDGDKSAFTLGRAIHLASDSDSEYSWM